MIEKQGLVIRMPCSPCLSRAVTCVAQPLPSPVHSYKARVRQSAPNLIARVKAVEYNGATGGQLSGLLLFT